MDSAGGLLDECYQKVKEEVKKVLSTEGRFVCITSDAWSNVTTNKKAWGELEKKYPTHFFHGCVSHGLHLLVKDIFAAMKDSQVAVLLNIQLVIHLKTCSSSLSTARLLPFSITTMFLRQS